MSRTKKKVASSLVHCDCGGNCTYSSFLDVTTRTAKLCVRLGAAWSGNVRDNLGWHGAAKSPNGAVQVSLPKRGGDRYCAYFTTGSPFVGHGPTPREAVIHLHEQFVERIKDLSVAAEKILECL